MSNQTIIEQLRQLNISKLSTADGKSLEEELGRHARMLQLCLNYELGKVYVSYKPVVYNRKNALLHSMKADVRPVITRNGNKVGLSVRAYFDELSVHRGLDGLPADAEVLINEGWQTHGTFADVPYFGFREGTHFMERAIGLYQRMARKPFPIKLNIAGETRSFD